MRSFKQRKERKDSSIYNIRIFHNWIKRQLIEQSKRILDNQYSLKNISLLDLSVGKAGDLQKWYDNDIMYVVGFDIDEKSINEAKKRYEQLIYTLKKEKKSIPNYEFYVMDLSQSKNIKCIENILQNKKFDIVSCQFAIHYFFEYDTSLDTFMKIVGKYISNNGIFIGTTMDGNILQELFKKSNVIQNDLFKIESKIDQFTGYYGNKYLVSLGKNTDESHYFVNNLLIKKY